MVKLRLFAKIVGFMALVALFMIAAIAAWATFPYIFFHHLEYPYGG